MSDHIHKRHNVSLLLYHLVCPSKYRRWVFTDEAGEALRKGCFEISVRYEIVFLEIGSDKDHVHFLIQSVPDMSPTEMVRRIKSITAREIFLRVPAVKKYLWGGQFWSIGFYINTVSRFGNEHTIRNYVANQGIADQYQQLHVQQLALF